MDEQWLKQNKIRALIDIEGQGASAMLERCQDMLDKHEDELLADGMKWRELKRKPSLIDKEYLMEKNIMTEEQEAAEEFADRVWNDFKDIVSAVFETAMDETAPL